MLGDKFSLYETLGILVPGTMLVYSVLVLAPDLRSIAATNNAAINAGAFAALAIFAGQLVQALASFAEPLLYKAWGGRPSEVALEHGLGRRYLSKESAERLQQKLTTAVGRPDSKSQDLFQFAMSKANGVTGSRVETFNAQFAYHRSLLILCITECGLLIASRWLGSMKSVSRGLFATLLVLDALVFLVLILRTRQRAFYYVREVLVTAERALDAEAKRPVTP